jgi:hypothetical protein
VGRTRLFHTIVIVGSSLLANCEKGPAPVAKKDATRDAAVKDAPNIPLIDAAPEVIRIMAAPPDPPRIHAITPEKMGETRVPAPPRIQVRHKPPKAPRMPRI